MTGGEFQSARAKGRDPFCFLRRCMCTTNVPRETRFRELNGSCIDKRRDEPPDIVEDGTASQTTQPGDAGNMLAGLRVLNFRLACSDRCRFLRKTAACDRAS